MSQYDNEIVSWNFVEIGAPDWPDWRDITYENTKRLSPFDDGIVRIAYSLCTQRLVLKYSYARRSMSSFTWFFENWPLSSFVAREGDQVSGGEIMRQIQLSHEEWQFPYL